MPSQTTPGRACYTRLGLYPNLGLSWVTAFICGSDRPAVAVIDFAAPLPGGDSLVVDKPGLHADHICESEFERFQVRLRGAGEQHTDAAAFLRGEAGEKVDVAFDLRWQTLGAPYAYRVATRYEIPCSVAGTVRVGEETIELRGVGQRDHSWGVRDWWSADWMWSAGHLDDGTRFHGVEFRLPGAPPIGVGYLQPPDGELVELDVVSASETVGRDGLITKAQVLYDELVLSVEPIAFGPLRLAGAGRPHLRVPPRNVPREDGRRPRGRGLGRVEPQRDRRLMPIADGTVSSPAPATWPGLVSSWPAACNRRARRLGGARSG